MGTQSNGSAVVVISGETYTPVVVGTVVMGATVVSLPYSQFSPVPSSYSTYKVLWLFFVFLAPLNVLPDCTVACWLTYACYSACFFWPILNEKWFLCYSIIVRNTVVYCNVMHLVFMFVSQYVAYCVYHILVNVLMRVSWERTLVDFLLVWASNLVDFLWASNLVDFLHLWMF